MSMYRKQYAACVWDIAHNTLGTQGWLNIYMPVQVSALLA